jgi:hypothetical protein
LSKDERPKSGKRASGILIPLRTGFGALVQKGWILAHGAKISKKKTISRKLWGVGHESFCTQENACTRRLGFHVAYMTSLIMFMLLAAG